MEKNIIMIVFGLALGFVGVMTFLNPQRFIDSLNGSVLEGAFGSKFAGIIFKFITAPLFVIGGIVCIVFAVTDLMK